MVALGTHHRAVDGRLFERLVRLGMTRYHLPATGARSAAIRTLAVFQDLHMKAIGLLNPPRALALAHRNACLRSVQAWTAREGGTPAEAPGIVAPDTPASIRAARVREAASSDDAPRRLPEFCRIALWDPDRRVRSAAHLAVRRLAAIARPAEPPGPSRASLSWHDLMLLRRYVSGVTLPELAREHQESEAELRGQLGYALECLTAAGFGEEDWTERIMATVRPWDSAPGTPWIHPPARDARMDVLLDALRDRDAAARRAAAREIGHAGGLAGDALARLKRVADDDPDREVRRAARCAVVRVMGWQR